MAKAGLLRITLALAMATAALTGLAAAQTEAPPGAPDYPPVAPGDPTVVPQPRLPSGVVFDSVLALDQKPGEMQPQIRGGREADSVTWQASLFAPFPGGGSCTAALVGPQTVLTAAHCAPTGQISFRFPSRSEPYVAWCTIDEDYKSAADLSADFALCHLAGTETVIVPNGFLFETISLEPFDKLVNVTLTLGGYGCMTDEVANTTISKTYRIGPALIIENSNSPARSLGRTYYADPRYRRAQKNNLMTSTAVGRVNLCKGDSGGPAFRVYPGVSTYGVRLIVGVNSRALTQRDDATRYGASLIAATGGPRFREWAVEWAKKHYVCGLSEQRKTFCRGWS